MPIPDYLVGKTQAAVTLCISCSPCAVVNSKSSLKFTSVRHLVTDRRKTANKTWYLTFPFHVLG